MNGDRIKGLRSWQRKRMSVRRKRIRRRVGRKKERRYVNVKRARTRERERERKNTWKRKEKLRRE